MIKNENQILKIYPKWNELGDSYDDEKYAEIYESDVRSLLLLTVKIMDMK